MVRERRWEGRVEGKEGKGERGRVRARGMKRGGWSGGGDRGRGRGRWRVGANDDTKEGRFDNKFSEVFSFRKLGAIELRCCVIHCK